MSEPGKSTEPGKSDESGKNTESGKSTELGKSLLAPLLRLLDMKGPQAQWFKGSLLVALVGFTLLVMSGPMGLSRPGASSGPAEGGTAAAAPAAGSGGNELATDEDAIARRLEGILARVQGVGQVRVQVTLAAGPSRVVQVDPKKTTRTTQEKDTNGGTRQISEADESSQMVLVHGNSAGADAPVVLQVNRPAVAGVLVVAEGAGDPNVRAELARAVSVALGIPLNHIQVEEGR